MNGLLSRQPSLGVVMEEAEMFDETIKYQIDT